MSAKRKRNSIVRAPQLSLDRVYFCTSNQQLPHQQNSSIWHQIAFARRIVQEGNGLLTSHGISAESLAVVLDTLVASGLVFS